MGIQSLVAFGKPGSFSAGSTLSATVATTFGDSVDNA